MSDDQPDAASKLKEYRATTGEESEPATAQPNVASSSVVLHLNVTDRACPPAAASEDRHYGSHNYEREFLNYKPDVTLPYAYTEEDTFSVRPEEVSKPDETIQESEDEEPGTDGTVVRDPPVQNDFVSAPAAADTDDGTSYATRVTSVLRDIERKSNEDEWPLSTSVSCYWCCHPFEGPPMGLPVKAFSSGDGFYVTGCFCSLSCASAFNLEGRESHDTVCERQAMLSELSRLIHGNQDVRGAPDWRALLKFGGYMSIDQFRAFSSEPKVLLTNVPPMRSLTTQLEEVNEGNVGSGYNFVPLDPDRIERGIQELSLKRNKPRNDYKNTIDHKMSVVITPMAGT